MKNIFLEYFERASEIMRERRMCGDVNIFTIRKITTATEKPISRRCVQSTIN